MYPYIHIGSLSIGTFGIMLWLAAVCAAWALHANFERWNIDADAIGIVAVATVAGVVGAKLWHVLEDPQTLIQHPISTIFDRAGFAWFGGLVLGIAALLWQGRTHGVGKLRMLDLCTVSAAIGYSQESGIPFAAGLIRNHYVGRTFIEPKTKIRNLGVKVKLNPVRELLAGKRVILIDDSIVRGTTSRKIVKMVRAAGAKEVHMRISCPPTLSPCFYGIDTPTKKELIASSHTVEEIGKYIEADSLGYLSLQGLIRAVGGKGNEFCTACYTGQYPIDFADMMLDAKGEDRQLDLWEASLKQ